MKKTGRPMLISRKKITDICSHISMGMSIRDSAILSELSPSTLEKWLQRGRDLLKGYTESAAETTEDKDSLLMDLVREVEESQARFKEQLYAVALGQARDLKDGRMALDLLARKWPAEFGKKDQQRSNSIHVNLSRLEIINSEGALNERELIKYIDDLEQSAISDLRRIESKADKRVEKEKDDFTESQED